MTPKPAQVAELVAWAERHRRLWEIFDAVKRLRPKHFSMGTEETVELKGFRGS